jgi:hypothetical protein
MLGLVSLPAEGAAAVVADAAGEVQAVDDVGQPAQARRPQAAARAQDAAEHGLIAFGREGQRAAAHGDAPMRRRCGWRGRQHRAEVGLLEAGVPGRHVHEVALGRGLSHGLGAHLARQQRGKQRQGEHGAAGAAQKLAAGELVEDRLHGYLAIDLNSGRCTMAANRLRRFAPLAACARSDSTISLSSSVSARPKA